MSSMLKKAGGLSFKPKAARRPAGPSKAPVAPAPTASTTEAPRTSTPTTIDPPNPPTSGVVADSIETAQEYEKQSIPTKQPPKLANPTPSTIEPSINEPVDQSISKPAVSPPPPATTITQNPTPPPSAETTQNLDPHSEPNAPAVNSPGHDTQQTLDAEPENESPVASATSSETPVVKPAASSEAPSLEDEVSSGPATTSASPTPASDANSAISQPSEFAAPPPTASEPTASKKPASRRRKSTAVDSEADADDSAPKRKRQRKAPSSSRKASEASEGSSAGSQKPAKRRARGLPEDPESVTIDHSKMTVGELTKDLGIGKRFVHAEEIEQRAREARAKYRLKKLDREKIRQGLLSQEETDPNATEGGASQGAALAQLGASMEAGASQSVGYDVVDGQIVVHAASLVVNRHNRDMSNLEEVEENDFTNLVNSASFSKRVQAPGSWPDEDTEKFYRLLGMFGTDFETISKLFPGKNRRAIKLKFNKEERLNPGRVNATMMVRGQKKVNIDIEEYKASQQQWQTKDKILAEHARLTEEHEREVARVREERRAAGLIDDDQPRPPANGNANGAQVSGEMEIIEEDADLLGQA
ncbi:hypothetical protein GGR50DRAFT_521328 [Xylaria sp. CBS 124048]|nr:hypothetical protein GGR50DRAFT_521328 [Xylaria sp. CBS 124048]